MKLSTKGRYGVKAMVDLAIHYGGSPVSIKSISQRQNISEYYLEQLFSSLRKAKLIKSIRGAQGGYILNRQPEDITVSDIIEVLEGPIEISDCLWKKIKTSIDEVTNSVTLKDIVEDYKAMKEKNEALKIVSRSEENE